MPHPIMNNKKHKKIHQDRAVPKIDNKAPHFQASAFLKAFKLKQDFMRIRNIDAENMRLLKNMNIVHRLGGPVDCWAPDFEYKTRYLDDQDRRNDSIMQENKVMLKRIRQAESQYPARVLLKQWRRARKVTEHRARYVSIIGRLPANEREQLAELGKTRCFFDVGLEGKDQTFGRIVFQLYDSVVPRTCENFAAFCRGTNGLSYKNTPFHRIVSGYWCQGGDVTKFNGTGGTSIYGNSFAKENLRFCHIGPGVLSMCNNDDSRNNSKFNLTFRRLETADGDRVVFGRVIDGMVNIYKVTPVAFLWQGQTRRK